LPAVHEVEEAVVRPDALPQLLVYPHPLRWSLSVLIALSGLVKPTVLRRGAVGGTLGLIDDFRTGNRIAPRLIVALVD
jgi:hypothetical protein